MTQPEVANSHPSRCVGPCASVAPWSPVKTSVPARTIAAVRPRIPHPICNTDTRGSTVAGDEAAGVKLVLYYALPLYAAYRAVRDALAVLRRTGDAGALRDRLAEEPELDAFTGFGRIEALAARHGLA